MIKKITWYSIAAVSAAMLILFTSGFYKAMKITYNAKIALNEKNVEEEKNRTAPSLNPRNKKNSVSITIIGDSIAKGTGDEKGKGLSGYIPDYFKNQTSKDIIVNNAGIPGLHVSGLLEQLQSGKLDMLTSDSDYIVISIGGNDARGISSVNDISKDDEFSSILNRYLSNLKESIKLIRKSNPECIIIFIGLYSPEPGNGNSRFINEWNYKTESAVDGDINTVFLSTYGTFKLNSNRFIAPDKLHPNSAGYLAISSMISKSVESRLVKGK